MQEIHSSKVSRDKGPFENGSRIEFLLFVDQFHRHTVALHPLPGLSSRDLHRGYSSPVFAALRRTPINRIIRKRPLPWNGQLIWLPLKFSSLSHFQGSARKGVSAENHRGPRYPEYDI